MKKHGLGSYRKREVAGHRLSPETLMMGYGYDPHLSEGALKVPVFQTSTFVFRTAQDGKDFFAAMAGRRDGSNEPPPGLIYSRFNNPDLEVLEDRLALWEDGEAALVFSSGMAAISTALWAVVRPGEVIVHSEPLYGGTQTLLQNFLPQFRVGAVGFPAGARPEEIDRVVAAARAQGRIAAIFVETPANPTNSLVDLAHCAAVARRIEAEDGYRPPVMVDNTFLGPLWQHPLALGCDLAIYSLTKYVGGHSDLVAGSVVGARGLIDRIRKVRSSLGTITEPYTGWLLMRSLETLKLRMTAAMNNARTVAEFLRRHRKVAAVHYLGFLQPDHADYALYRRQCEAPGSTFSFEVVGGEAAAFRALDALQVVKLAVSLGGTESLASHPASTTHSGLTPDTLERIGITPGMIRLSVGIENADDLIADLGQALAVG
ncbi:MAG: cystathionine gamma-synthase family protein [Proteobacteria bacterium]|nr:cystathionine gamma-synthase family protein [Pseudomonadota bacterium]